MVPPGKPLNGLKQEKKKALNVSFVKSELSLKCENINILTRTSLKNVAIHCERLLEEGSDMKRDKPGGGGGCCKRHGVKGDATPRQSLLSEPSGGGLRPQQPETSAPWKRRETETKTTSKLS